MSNLSISNIISSCKSRLPGRNKIKESSIETDKKPGLTSMQMEQLKYDAYKAMGEKQCSYTIRRCIKKLDKLPDRNDTLNKMTDYLQSAPAEEQRELFSKILKNIDWNDTSDKPFIICNGLTPSILRMPEDQMFDAAKELLENIAHKDPDQVNRICLSLAGVLQDAPKGVKTSEFFNLIYRYTDPRISTSEKSYVTDGNYIYSCLMEVIPDLKEGKDRKDAFYDIYNSINTIDNYGLGGCYVEKTDICHGNYSFGKMADIVRYLDPDDRTDAAKALVKKITMPKISDHERSFASNVNKANYAYTKIASIIPCLHEKDRFDLFKNIAKLASQKEIYSAKDLNQELENVLKSLPADKRLKAGAILTRMDEERESYIEAQRKQKKSNTIN